MGSTRSSSTPRNRAPGSVPKTQGPRPSTAASLSAQVVLDRYRGFVFPNRIREQRRRLGFLKLMALSERLSDIPYIRLSKIERGEVVARASELKRIARALEVAPADLLIDVTQPGFHIADWAQPFQDGRAASEDEERFAVMLAAALRVLRSSDAALTIAALEKDYGLPPVILSRLENAYKTFDRWNLATIASLCRLFGVADEAALRGLVMERFRRGDLDDYVGRIADPEIRMARTRSAVENLRAELAAPSSAMPLSPSLLPVASATSGPSPEPGKTHELPVVGIPLPGGLIALTPTGEFVQATSGAGTRSIALRVCRATLGPGLPASAIVVADPDRRPTAGSVAVIRVGESGRLVSVTFDRTGAMKGYSVTPDLEFDIDDLDPNDVYAVIGAIYP